jgi:hypothetical protein
MAIIGVVLARELRHRPRLAIPGRGSAKHWPVASNQAHVDELRDQVCLLGLEREKVTGLRLPFEQEEVAQTDPLVSTSDEARSAPFSEGNPEPNASSNPPLLLCIEPDADLERYAQRHPRRPTIVSVTSMFDGNAITQCEGVADARHSIRS